MNFTSENRKYCCLILTKNEENSILAVIQGVRAELLALGIGEPGLVLSDDSTDKTSEIACSQGAVVVSAGNRGLGKAYVVGLKKCVELGADRIFVLDGDGQSDFSEMRAFIQAMDEQNADLVTGSRFLRDDLISYDYPTVNRVGTRLLSSYISWMTGQKFTDSHGGLRLMTSKLARSQKIYGSHTYIQESIVDAVERGFKVVEIPSRWNKRAHGSSKVVKSVVRYAGRTLPYLVLRIVRR